MSIIDTIKNYNGNVNLVRQGTKFQWTPEMLLDLEKCEKDPIYFAEKHFKVVHVDHGLMDIRLFDYQKEIIEAFQLNRKIAACQSRQSGKCVSIDTQINLRLKETEHYESITLRDFIKRLLIEAGRLSASEEVTDESLIEKFKLHCEHHQNIGGISPE